MRQKRFMPFSVLRPLNDGLSLVQRAMVTLENGGMLLVDELENHLNS